MTEFATPHPDKVDPDPFVIAQGLIQLVVAGATFLEWRARRQRDFNRYRTKWHAAKRTLIRARAVVEEFQSFTSEHRYGDQRFYFGEVRLKLSKKEAKYLRSMVTETSRVTSAMAVNIDEMSEFIGSEHQDLIENIMDKVQENQRPHSYDAVIILAAYAIDLFEKLLSRLEDEIRG